MSVSRPETITMREVARRANVSVATVSRVFNESGPVKEATRSRIEAIARELRYVPNRAARSLNTRRTDTIGALLPDLYGEFYSELLRGLDRAARTHGLHLLVAGAHGDRAELTRAARAMHGRADGLIVMSPEVSGETLRQSLPPDLPLVFLGGPGAALAIDNHGGAYAGTHHLIGLGHRRVAHLRGLEGNRDAEERLAGYLAAMDDAGLAAHGLVLDGDFGEAAGAAAVAEILALPEAERPTALFAANDAMAVGALGALREAGRSVPRDLALVGFDDVPLAAHLTPALTTVHVPTADLGTAAVDHLALGRGEVPPRTLAATLVVRASCGAV